MNTKPFNNTFVKLAKKTFITLVSAVLIASPLLQLFGGAGAVASEILNDEKDTRLVETVDGYVDTKTGVARSIPSSTVGKFDRSVYGIPGVKNADTSKWGEIVAENQELMTKLEETIAGGKLKKHVAADGQWRGTVSNDQKAVQREFYLNTNLTGTHSTGLYIPAGEVATVTIPEIWMPYFRNNTFRMRVGDASESTGSDKGNAANMPLKSYTFTAPAEGNQMKIGTPFGGMIYVTVTNGCAQGLEVPITISGAIVAPYYQLGSTTKAEWDAMRNSSAPMAELRNNYMRFVVPTVFVKNIEDPKYIMNYWENVSAISTYPYGATSRRLPVTMYFQEYVPAGAAVAFVGAWFSVHPASWATGSLSYETMTQAGGWGTMHEFNHHWQGTYNSNGKWTYTSGGAATEVTNNVMTVLSYVSLTNIAMGRTEGCGGLDGWNQIVDPYCNLNVAMSATANGPTENPYVYSSFIHEFGVEKFEEVIRSNYAGGTYNGVSIGAYNTADTRVDDMAYRMSVVFGKDLSEYMTKTLKWDLSDATLEKIKALKFEKYFPITNVYSAGVKGVETGRAFFLPNTKTNVLNLEARTKTPGELNSITATSPKYGKISRNDNGTWTYTREVPIPDGQYEEFDINVTATFNGIKNTRTLHMKFGFDHQYSNYEKYYVNEDMSKVTVRDFDAALEYIKDKKPYASGVFKTAGFNTDTGNNFTRGYGYFTVPKTATYEVQVFGDDIARGYVEVNDKEYESRITSWAANAANAYGNSRSTHFEVKLEAGKAYRYKIDVLNTGGGGNGYLAYRVVDGVENKTATEPAWTNVTVPYVNPEDVGKTVSKSAVGLLNSTKYYRPVYMPTNKKSSPVPAGAKVLSGPRLQNGDTASLQNIIDGNTGTFAHAAYSGAQTAWPHEWVMDLTDEMPEFNQIDIIIRAGNNNLRDAIGDYEIYTSEDNEKWEKIAEDNGRYGNSAVPNNITVKLKESIAPRYLKLVAKNCKTGGKFEVLAEVAFSTSAPVKNRIAQNSSLLDLSGDWTKNKGGVFINGAAYKTTSGTLKFAVESDSAMVYSSTDAEVEISVNGEEWKKYKMTGSRYNPALVLTDMPGKTNNIEMRVVGGTLNLDELASEGAFVKFRKVTPEKPDEPEDPDKPSDPSEPDDPSDPDKPGDDEPSKPSDPDNPEDPKDPEDPSKPSDPENPDDPSKPSSDPTTPDDPSKPDDPSTPEDPSKPSDPSTPSEPSKPGDSKDPSSDPGNSSRPNKKPAADKPSDSEKPGDTDKPTDSDGSDKPSEDEPSKEPGSSEKPSGSDDSNKKPSEDKTSTEKPSGDKTPSSDKTPSKKPSANKPEIPTQPSKPSDYLPGSDDYSQVIVPSKDPNLDGTAGEVATAPANPTPESINVDENKDLLSKELEDKTDEDIKKAENLPGTGPKPIDVVATVVRVIALTILGFAGFCKVKRRIDRNRRDRSL